MGHGGTGKTFQWNTIISKLRSQSKIVLPVATSRIAALLLPNGRTAHSRFHIPLDVSVESTCEIKQGSQLAELLPKTSLIIWDEASMANKFCFEALDGTLRDILRVKYENNSDKPFGGLTVVFGGNFRQILPVIPKGTRADIIDASLNSSYLWPFLTVYQLKQNMRLCSGKVTDREAAEVTTFDKWLLQIGDGSFYDDVNNELIKLPPDICITSSNDPIDSIVEAVYPSLLQNYNDPAYLKERAILTPKNEMVQELNDTIMKMIPALILVDFSRKAHPPLPCDDGVINELTNFAIDHSVDIGRPNEATWLFAFSPPNEFNLLICLTFVVFWKDFCLCLQWLLSLLLLLRMYSFLPMFSDHHVTLAHLKDTPTQAQPQSSSTLGVSSSVRSAAARLLGGNGTASSTFRFTITTSVFTLALYSLSLRQQLQHIGKKLLGPQHYNKDGVEHNEEGQQDEYSHTQTLQTRPFVRRSASCSLVLTYSVWISPLLPFSNKMTIDLYVFSPLMKNRIGPDLNCCFAVTVNLNRCDHINIKFLKYSNQPNDF
ncbi:hypothetical protein FXO38_30937 [Capsicum annuum]|nr:hypothetical protein FXO38_30937 [Capsicum annuum]